MKIGKLEIRWHGRCSYAHARVTNKMVDALDPRFAVADDNPLWLAIHQAIDEVEWETIQTARNHTGLPNLCIGDIGAGEGCSMIRLRLQEKRANALEDLKKRTQYAP